MTYHIFTTDSCYLAKQAKSTVVTPWLDINPIGTRRSDMRHLATIPSHSHHTVWYNKITKSERQLWWSAWFTSRFRLSAVIKYNFIIHLQKNNNKYHFAPRPVGLHTNISVTAGGGLKSLERTRIIAAKQPPHVRTNWLAVMHVMEQWQHYSNNAKQPRISQGVSVRTNNSQLRFYVSFGRSRINCINFQVFTLKFPVFREKL